MISPCSAMYASMRVSGIELARSQVGVGNADRELGLQRRHHVGEREGIEQAGFEQRFVGLRRDRFAGNAADDFNDLALLVHEESLQVSSRAFLNASYCCIRSSNKTAASRRYPAAVKWTRSACPSPAVTQSASSLCRPCARACPSRRSRCRGRRLSCASMIQSIPGTVFHAGAIARPAVVGTQHQNGSRGRSAAQALRAARRACAIALRIPVRVARFVGAVGQHNQSRIASVASKWPSSLVPLQHHRWLPRR